MKLLTGSIALALMLGTQATTHAQETAPPQDPAAQTDAQKKAKEESRRKAYSVLDQVVSDAQLLRLSENRIRVQTSVADLLWTENEGRARSLFGLAADGLVEMQRASETSDQRRGNRDALTIDTSAFNGRSAARTVPQLRQELILTVARHDAAFAYQLLAVTRPATESATSTTQRSFERGGDLEERLLAQVAALDPKLALQNAELYLEKGEYPRSLAQVLAELQRKDKEAALRLEEKLMKKLRSVNMLGSNDVSSLVFSLLQPGPITSATTTESPATSQRQLLTAQAYQELLGLMVDAALKATPPANSQPINQRGRGRNNSGGSAPQDQLTAAQIEQMNARRLIATVRILTPKIYQHLPTRLAAVRQKFTEFGMPDPSVVATAQVPNLVDQGSSENLLAAAARAPAAVQQRMYQQAAQKALDEGKPDQARQIANEHLDARTRDAVLRNVEFRQLADKTEPNNLEQVREKLAGLASDSERVDLLVQVAQSSRQKSPEFALQLLDEARQLTSRRATSYQHLDQQLRVAAAYRGLDDARSFEVLEPGINLLNELLSAAAVLSGFEVNIFSGGEMPMQGGNGLTDMVRRYSQEIARLAATDFERAQTLANRFQFTESRIVARMAISRSLLDAEQTGTENRFRGPGAGRGGFNRIERN